MLGFLDESGDTGLKVTRGSSRYFVVALVTFDDDAEALRCDRRIEQLRHDLRLAATYEFLYAKNPTRVRQAFIQAVQPFRFGCHVFSLDKPDGLTFREIRSIDNLYEHCAGLPFDNAGPNLSDLILIVDRRGDRRVRTELSRLLRNNLRSVNGDHLIKRIKQQDSRRNNLLQLADYVASIEGRALAGSVDGQDLQNSYLKRREITGLTWPK